MLEKFIFTRELKTGRGHLMPPQQHLYDGLARPADYSILHGNGVETDLPAQTPRWPTAVRTRSLETNILEANRDIK